MDMRGFLERFRSDRSPHAPLEAVALVTQCLLIGKSGDLVPTRIVTEVQVREFSRSPRGELSKTQIGEFELSRRAMLADPGSGGLAALGETSPAYLAAAGNDYAFATAIDSSDGKARDVAILGSLRARCVGCHGADVGTLFTFSKHDPLEGQIQILAKRLTEHAQYVIEQKMQLESWKSLQELWQQN